MFGFKVARLNRQTISNRCIAGRVARTERCTQPPAAADNADFAAKVPTHRRDPQRVIQYLRLAGAIVIFVAMARYFEQSGGFANYKALYQKQFVAQGEMGDGKIQSAFRRAGLLRVAPSSQGRLGKVVIQKRPPKLRARRYDFTELRLKNSGFHDQVFQSIAGDPDRLPVVSVVARDEDLYGLPYGILATPNRRERGRFWERRAFVAYFDAGRKLFETFAGLRLHGGSSRSRSIESGNPSLRLHFRDSYGLDATPPGAFFSGTSPPLRTVILHNDVRFKTDQFASPLAYDIARRLGCIVPATQPIEVFINGRRVDNVYFLTEYMSQEYVRRRLGHDDFEFNDIRVRGQTNKSTRPVFYAKRLRWAHNAPAPLTVEEVARQFDIDNLLSWIVSISFNATTDPHQGFYVHDQRTGKFLIMAWDMDHSFQIRLVHIFNYSEDRKKRYYEYIRNNEHYKERTFELRKDRQFLHSVLYERLMAEDPSFRRLLAKRALSALNHLVTPDFIAERLAYYRDVASRFGLKDVSFLDRYEHFFKHRPKFYRGEMERLLQTGPIRTCTVNAPGDLKLTIDGHAHTGSYRGHYLTGSTIRIRLADFAGQPACSWLVNGQPQTPSEGELSVEVVGDVDIAYAHRPPS